MTLNDLENKEVFLALKEPYKTGSNLLKSGKYIFRELVPVNFCTVTRLRAGKPCKLTYFLPLRHIEYIEYIEVNGCKYKPLP